LSLLFMFGSIPVPREQILNFFLPSSNSSYLQQNPLN
jgi:hypothetical protein